MAEDHTKHNYFNNLSENTRNLATPAACSRVRFFATQPGRFFEQRRIKHKTRAFHM
jgi:hypothetical protein